MCVYIYCVMFMYTCIVLYMYTYTYSYVGSVFLRGQFKFICAYDQQSP